VVRPTALPQAPRFLPCCFWQTSFFDIVPFLSAITICSATSSSPAPAFADVLQGTLPAFLARLQPSARYPGLNFLEIFSHRFNFPLLIFPVRSKFLSHELPSPNCERGVPFRLTTFSFVPTLFHPSICFFLISCFCESLVFSRFLLERGISMRGGKSFFFFRPVGFPF